MTDYKILDILELEPVSNRLRNALMRAYHQGEMPVDTILEYRQTKEETIQRLHRLPNIGKKTINELISLLEKYTQDHTGVTSPASRELSIPDAFKNISIVAFIRSAHCSVRLEHALIGAIERHEFLSETLGGLDGKSIHALKSELHRIQNLGRKSVEEFLELLNTIPQDSVKGINSQVTNQAEVQSEINKVDWVSEYLFLIKKECHSDLTIEDIIRRMPGRSRSEERLLKALNQEYSGIPFFQVLASSNGKVDELSKSLISDDKLSSQLQSILLDFYRFLLSKRNRRFNHEEYFSDDFSVLNEKQSKILLSRFGTDKQTLDELGKEFGVTRERIRQIEAKALRNYIKANRVGLLHLSESLEKYVKASKGVLSIDVIKNLYRISEQKLELALNFVIPENDDSWISREGKYLISSDFKMRQDAVFGNIEASIYSQAGYGGTITPRLKDDVSSQIFRYFLFVHHRKFCMNADGSIELVMKSASERARAVLTVAGQPIHTSEATRLYNILFKEDITEHTIAATLGRLPDGLIVAPGTYALYSHLKLSSEDINSIRDIAHELIESTGRYLSSRIIFEHICRLSPELRIKEPFFNYHLVLGALQDDDRYQTKRGFMVGLTSFGDHLPLETEVEELVERHGPVSISEIIDLLRPTRGELTNGSVRNTLVASDEIFLTSEERKWDVAERVFNYPSDIRRLQIAIRLAAYKEMVALSSIYNRIRSTGLNYGIGTILSVVWKDPETKREGDYVGFFGTDVEIEAYYSTGEPETISDLDYQNYTEERSIDTDILDSLVREFDLSV